MFERQRQVAGQGAQQIQVAGDLIYGLTEARAGEIMRAQAREILLQEFSQEAQAIADRRIAKFSEMLVSNFSKLELLSSFGEPAFQILLRRAQMHAAATDGGVSHELLTGLLSQRAETSARRVHLAVHRAVEVVEFIDDETLLAVTLLWLFTKTIPMGPKVERSLDYRERMLERLIGESDLPSGTGWQETADLLSCIDYMRTGESSFVKWKDAFYASIPGAVSMPIQPEAAESVRESLRAIDAGLESCLVENVFIPGTYVVEFPGGHRVEHVKKFLAAYLGADQQERLAALIEELQWGILDLTMKDAVHEHVVANYPAIRRVAEWWDRLDGWASLTSVGIAIAYSNMRRHDEMPGLGGLSSVLGD
jgi:hypothetical protein